MIKVLYRNKQNSEISEIEDFKRGALVYVECPTEEERNILISELNLEEGLVQDALDPNEVPRYELEDGIKYFFLRYVKRTSDKFETVPFLVAIADNNVFLVCSEKFPYLDRLGRNPEFYTTKKTKAFIQVLMLVNNDYRAYTHQISKEVKILSAQIEKIENRDIVKFVNYERTLEDFLSALLPSNIILENLLYGKTLRLFDEDEDLLEDVSLSNNQLIELCKTNTKHISHIREAYSTIMSNNLNKTMKFLTSITIIMTVPTIISSFYGMNVALPFDQHPLMWLWLTSFTILSSAVLLYIFMKNKLL